MTRYKIAVLPGDGVGKEVIEAAMMVLDAVGFKADYRYGDVGWEFWKKEGNPFPERTIKLLKETDACLFGAITSKPKDEAAKELSPELQGKGYVYYSPIVAIRQIFQLYANMRPCRAFPGNPLNYRDDIDVVVFRENTEGLYSGVEFHPVPGELRETLERLHPKMEAFKEIPSEDMAITLRIITRRGAERIIRKAFSYAREMGRKKVTVVEKPNVLRETSGLMVRIAREIHRREFSDIELEEANIDAMAMWLVKNPERYEVLVTSNLFGDVISDLAAQLVGGLGFASAANMGDDYGVFEPTHGSAPKYAGLYKVNPVATILASKLMLDYLGEKEMAGRIESAVAEVIREGRVRTYDMGGDASTLDMAKAIAEKL
ncbi:MAG: isocitrate/isopropylmalate dehydrogenase family protein [Thermoplasmata archaeon]|nr:isocitrate/isopropylmalate dehydrogenase family protein [Thermoplasmata archaeon]